MQRRCNSIVLAMELHLFCIKPSLYDLVQDSFNYSALAMELPQTCFKRPIYGLGTIVIPLYSEKSQNTES